MLDARAERYRLFGQRGGILEILAVTYVRDVGPEQALARMGAEPGTARVMSLPEINDVAHSFTAGYPSIARARRVGDWTMVIEVHSVEGGRPAVLRALSRGTQACGFRKILERERFSYAVDGEVVTAFDPWSPGCREGVDPDRLLAMMGELGLVEPTEEVRLAAGACALALMESLSGVVVTDEDLRAPMTAAALLGLVDDPRDSHYRAEIQRRDPELYAAIEEAAPERQRGLALAAARRRATDTGLLEEDSAREQLRAAEAGELRPVDDHSPFGRHLRRLRAEADRLEQARADPAAPVSVDDGMRAAARELYQAGLALRAATLTDPRAAAYEVAGDPRWWLPGHERRRERMLDRLRGPVAQP